MNYFFGQEIIFMRQKKEYSYGYSNKLNKIISMQSEPDSPEDLEGDSLETIEYDSSGNIISHTRYGYYDDFETVITLEERNGSIILKRNGGGNVSESKYDGFPVSYWLISVGDPFRSNEISNTFTIMTSSETRDSYSENLMFYTKDRHYTVLDADENLPTKIRFIKNNIIAVFEYDNKRITRINYYNQENIMFSTVELKYNENGNLSEFKSFDRQGYLLMEAFFSWIKMKSNFTLNLFE
jgi:hypothetical protein